MRSQRSKQPLKTTKDEPGRAPEVPLQFVLPPHLGARPCPWAWCCSDPLAGSGSSFVGFRGCLDLCVRCRDTGYGRRTVAHYCEVISNHSGGLGTAHGRPSGQNIALFFNLEIRIIDISVYIWNIRASLRKPSGPLQMPGKPILNRKYGPRAFQRRAGRLLTPTTTPGRSCGSRY